MRYLIDGYNLAHKITLPPGKVTPEQLDAARAKLLTLIADGLGQLAGQACVIFDTRRSRGFETEQVIHGIDVRFAPGEQADDMIERLIHAHPNPHQLHVISDDHRLQTAARRRRSHVFTCDKFLDSLENRSLNQSPAGAPVEKPTVGSPDEWLAAFSDPEDD